MTKTFVGSSDVAFMDVNLSEEAIREGPDGEPYRYVYSISHSSRVSVAWHLSRRMVSDILTWNFFVTYLSIYLL